MRLEKIVLHGFKSFVDKTEVLVNPGITAVVGPNGCGKSNLADAIRWVLGEQSVKSLRGQKMDDVIFYGSASRKSVGLADVSLVFANDNGALPVPWSEILVSRRLYRTGESEYLLNKSVCRLKDIVELFAGSGVSPKAYALMEQERLNHILTAKPIERRILIEEAAGITRYKHQRAESLAKLAATRQNLTRVRDVMDEVRRQLSSLERQAKRAQQYKGLVQERQRLALALVAAEYISLLAKEESLGTEASRLQQALQALAVRGAAALAEIERLRAEVMTAEGALAAVRQSLQQVQGNAARLEERAGHLGSQQADLKLETDRLREEGRTLRERLHALEEERVAKVLTHQALLEEAEGAAGREIETNQTLEGVREELRRTRERLEASRSAQMEAAQRRSELTSAASVIEERLQGLSRQAERITAEAAQTREEEAALGRRRAESRDRQGRVAANLQGLVTGAERLEETERAQHETCDRIRRQTADIQLALASQRSILDALERLEAEREGYGSGPRAMFAAARSNPPGVTGFLGSVADLVEVPPDLERAVECALGDRLQWILVENFAQAQAALRFLEREGSGEATILPLDHLADRVGRMIGKGEVPPSGFPSLANLVSSSPGLRPLVDALLGQVLLVPSLEVATRLWGEDGGFSYVTGQGEMLTPLGSLTGGRRAGASDHSLLGRKRQIKDLHAEVGRLETSGRELAKALGREEEALHRLRTERESMIQSVRQQEGERLEISKDLEQLEREAERLASFKATLDVELAQVNQDLALGREEHEARLAEIRGAQERERQLEAEVAQGSSSIESLEREDAEAAQRLLAVRVEVSALGERAGGLERELEHLATMIGETRERLEQGENRHAAIQERLSLLSQELGETEAQALSLVKERETLERRYREQNEAYQALVQRLEGDEAESRELERRSADQTRTLHQVEVQSAEVRVRRADLESEAYRQFERDPSDLRAAHDPSADPEVQRQEMEALQVRIRSMEPVNLVADEEYRELDERLTFLRSQYDDLATSVKDIEKAIRGMTRTAHERFQAAFAEINRNFSRIFERLFEGGRAELRLVEPEEGSDALETGIDLVAQPYGKRLQSVSLLSGGEKALTGLALLFAIFYYRPSPFCVLDEVDAPLDDANIHRFLRVLKELARDTQFLVITHNRKTMEAADVLYGVTMEEPGLSRLVSVKLT